MKISPSLLACDLANIEAEINSVSEADFIHIDVMDGIFVPNISFGLPVISSARKHTDMIFDVHLMIDCPERYIEDFAKAGSDYLTIHAESTEDPVSVLKKIKSLGMKAGISIKPNTPVSEIKDCLPLADLVLVMTVEPGFGGQKLIENCLAKATELSALKKENGWNYIIEADGGIGSDNLERVAASGVEASVMGSAVYRIPEKERNAEIIRMKEVGIK